MKRFWLVLLSLGLIMAFSASAFAVDVKVSGEFDVAGLYLNKIRLGDRPGLITPNPSTAFYYQKLRIGTDFIVSPCLKLVTQFDALDRIWGGERSDADDTSWSTTNNGGTAGTRAESENFVMNLVYLEYTSPIGLFKVGYQNDFVFGTVWGDRGNGPTSGQIQYFLPIGPVILFAGLAKEVDNSASAVIGPSYANDQDFDSYRIAAIYGHGKKIEAGGLLLWNRNAEAKPAGFPNGFLANAFNLVPYFKAQVGPVFLQGELNWGFGKVKMEDEVTGHDMDISTLSVFLDATANLGMVYVGGSFAYVSGQDYGHTDKIESGLGNTGGLDWNPCLIMFNTDLNYWAGNISGWSGTTINNEMVNAWFGQGRIGVKPTPQLDAMLSISYATADKQLLAYPVNGDLVANKNYGWEVDLIGTYKITNNLSYMLGIGYLFTGDLFKGRSAFTDTTVDDDYILINKLTLTF